MNWREKLIKWHLNETLFASVFSVLFIFILIIANFFFNWNFDWKQIDPIETPPLWIRGIASLFTWFTLWSWLFHLYFYKILYWICKFLWISYFRYKKLKRQIWLWLMLLVTLVLIPIIIDLLNSIISLFFNILQFLIATKSFIGMSLSASLLIMLLYLYVTKKGASIIKNIK